MSRICLAIKRTVEKLKFCGLCHQIGFMHRHLPHVVDDKLQPENLEGVSSIEKVKRWEEGNANIRMKVAGLNHLAFLVGAEDLRTGEDLMPKFNERAMDYFIQHDDRFEFSTLTFEVHKKFGLFPYVGDNHLGEYLQFGEEFTKTQDMLDWLDFIEKDGEIRYKRYLKYYKRLKDGKFPKKGILYRVPSGERAIPIIEAVINDTNSYETAVNIPNNKIVDNLPQDLILECSAMVNRNGISGIRVGTLPKNIAALLRIEASVQDLCVEAVLKESKEIAIASLAIDPNVGNFEMAEKIFNEMIELQKGFLPNFK
jgi:alpha-galactosidase